MVEQPSAAINMDDIWKKSYPEGNQRNIEIPDSTVYKLLADSASKHPDAVAVILFGKKITYKKLLALVDVLALNLKERLRLFKDSKVGLILPNSPQYVISFFAIAKIGGVIVQTNPIYTETEIVNEYKTTETSAVITLDLYYPKVKNLAKDGVSIVVTSIKDFLTPLASMVYSRRTRKDPKPEKPVFEGRVFRFKDLIKSGSSPEEQVETKVDPVLFQFTGGTTGVPKAAMLSHYNLVANASQLKAWHSSLREPGKFMSTLPFFHVYGMMTSMILPATTASTMILVPDPRDTETLLKLIKKYKPDYLPGVPTLYKSIINHPDLKKFDLKSIKVCVSGGAALPVDTLKRFEEATGGLLIEGYGLSETSPVIAANPVDRNRRKVGSVGLPLSNTEFKIVNPYSLQEVPLGEEGEIFVRGPQVMLGYWRSESETAGVMDNGWLRTGDIGRFDNEGYLYLVDRKKDMIISSGYNVYPREIEEVFYKHPDVIEAAAIGVPDERRGQSVKVYVVKKEGSAVTEQELMAFASKQLAPYKRPRSVEFKKDLPRTLVGKVLKRELRTDQTRNPRVGRKP
jgi:long-chain acyl-CoA synthetase